TLRLTPKLKNLLRKARDLNTQAKKHKETSRNIKLTVKNLKGNFLYQRYVVDDACSLDCEFIPREEKGIELTDSYQEVLSLSPYSVNLIVFKERPKEPEPVEDTDKTQDASSNHE
ncbi:MAG: hypothetical protein NC928_04965, partial [Candidatus Omnitrophica bacterium]|nr:hypothetical protein [Candidatus Omnitrophota bacterium]